MEVNHGDLSARDSQGPRRVKKSGGGSNTHPWRGAREHEPIMGSGEGAPSGGSRGQSPGWGSGAKPPAADEVFVFKQ